MTTKVRKQIYIEDRQEAMLKRLAKATGQSEAEMIRAALDDWFAAQVQQQRAREAWEAEKAFITSLLAQGPVEGGRNWTRNAIYEERGDHDDQDSH